MKHLPNGNKTDVQFQNGLLMCNYISTWFQYSLSDKFKARFLSFFVFFFRYEIIDGISFKNCIGSCGEIDVKNIQKSRRIPPMKGTKQFELVNSIKRDQFEHNMLPSVTLVIFPHMLSFLA